MWRYILVLFVLYITSVTSAPIPKKPCFAYEILDDQIEEEWDFRLPYWENVTISYSSAEYNVPPYMSGVYTYRFTFCDSISVYMGISNPSQSFGWSFGSMSYFVAYDITPKNGSSHEYAAFLEFSQYYSNGDTGSPCTPQSPRSATVNLYCGLDKANCTQIPGNKGPQCIDGGITKPGFCLCSVNYNASRGLCSGLEFNILSNNCTKGVGYPIVGPSPNAIPQSHVGIAVAVIVSLIFLCCIFGFIYNTTVHGKRGCQAIPFYDACTSNKQRAPYDTVPVPSSSSTGVYGTT